MSFETCSNCPDTGLCHYLIMMAAEGIAGQAEKAASGAGPAGDLSEEVMDQTANNINKSYEYITGKFAEFACRYSKEEIKHFIGNAQNNG